MRSRVRCHVSVTFIFRKSLSDSLMEFLKAEKIDNVGPTVGPCDDPHDSAYSICHIGIKMKDWTKVKQWCIAKEITITE